jgi:hypothetical protein
MVLFPPVEPRIDASVPYPNGCRSGSTRDAMGGEDSYQERKSGNRVVMIAREGWGSHSERDHYTSQEKIDHKDERPQPYTTDRNRRYP